MDLSTLERFNPYDALTRGFKSDFDWEEFSRKVDSLPLPAQELLDNADTAGYLEGLAEDFQIPEGLVGFLPEIIGEILIGDTSISDLENSLVRQLNLDQTTAKQMTDRIVSELLSPLTNNSANDQQFPGPVSGQTEKNSLRQFSPEVNENNIIDLRRPN